MVWKVKGKVENVIKERNGKIKELEIKSLVIGGVCWLDPVQQEGDGRFSLQLYKRTLWRCRETPSTFWWFYFPSRQSTRSWLWAQGPVSPNQNYPGMFSAWKRIQIHHCTNFVASQFVYGSGFNHWERGLFYFGYFSNLGIWVLGVSILSMFPEVSAQLASGVNAHGLLSCICSIYSFRALAKTHCNWLVYLSVFFFWADNQSEVEIRWSRGNIWAQNDFLIHSVQQFSGKIWIWILGTNWIQ